MPSSVLEPVTEHTIEPALTGPLPRRARLPAGTVALLCIATTVLGVFLYGGSRALWEAGRLSWLAAVGHPATARIIAIKTQPSSVKGQLPIQTGIRYRFDDLALGTSAAGSETVLGTHESGIDQSTLNLKAHPIPLSLRPPIFTLGQTLRFRYVMVQGHPLIYPWEKPPYGKIGFLFLAGTLIMGASLVFLRRLFLWSRHRLTLLRHGIATVGTVIYKHAVVDDAPRYFIRYGYSDNSGSVGREHEEQCNAAQWRQFEIGQPVTVLYHPDRPEEASLYALIASS